MLPLPHIPVFCPPLPAFPVRENFLGDQEEVHFGEGADPFPFIEDCEDLEEKQLAVLCLATREVICRYMRHKKEANPDLPGISCLTPKILAGYCGFISSCLSFQLNQDPDLQARVQLIYHQTADVFPDRDAGRHMFIVACMGERFFIIDLSVRQFCSRDLRLYRSDIKTCDFLLKYGFVELTESSLRAYRRLLCRNPLVPSDQLGLVSLESLKQATAENDFEDAELCEFLSFQQKQLVRAHSQPIFARLAQKNPEDGGSNYRKMVRAKSSIV